MATKRKAQPGLVAAPKGSSGQVAVGDSFVNLMTGLGVEGKDSRLATRFVSYEMGMEQQDAAYRGDWASRKIIDIPANDSTRQWRGWQADPEQITILEKAERDLQIALKLNAAIKKARLYGGGALILGTDDDDADKPLLLDKIKEGSLKYVHAVSRWEVQAAPVIRNLMSPWYGQPEWYTRSNTAPDVGVPAQTKIHPSRVVRILGAPRLSDPAAGDGWGDSILQAILDAIADQGAVSGALASVVKDMKLDIWALPGLTENILNPEYRRQVIARFELSNAGKSTFNGMLMDKEDKFDRITTALSGTPDLLRVYLLILCAAADIPATRFLSQSPAGLSSTGESDLINYYDRIQADQVNTLQPAVSPLDEVLIRHCFGTRDEAIYYNWHSLWQMSEEKKVEVAKSKADTFKIDLDSGLFNEDLMRTIRKNQLVEDGTYPGMEAAIEEYGLEPEEPEIDPNSADPLANPAMLENQGNPIALAQAQAVNQQPRLGSSRGNPLPKAANTNKATAQPMVQTGTDTALAARLAAMRDNVADAMPRSLYVRRDVRNTAAILAWAKSQGFKTTMPPEELHVTVIYSKSQVDWLKLGSDDWGQQEDGGIRIPPGGPRIVETFGDGAVVLAFANTWLSYRHMRLRSEGLEVTYDEYNPHITLTYNAGGIDLTTVEPYTGEILLGPEIWEEAGGNAGTTITEVDTGATDAADGTLYNLVALDGQLQVLITTDGDLGKVVLTVDGDQFTGAWEGLGNGKHMARFNLNEGGELPHDSVLSYTLEATIDGEPETLLRGELISKSVEA